MESTCKVIIRTTESSSMAAQIINISTRHHFTVSMSTHVGCRKVCRDKCLIKIQATEKNLCMECVFFLFFFALLLKIFVIDAPAAQIAFDDHLHMSLLQASYKLLLCFMSCYFGLTTSRMCVYVVL